MSEGVLAVSDGYRVRNDELGPEGIPFVRGGDIGDGSIETRTVDHIRPEFADRVVAKLSRPGDVAFITKGTVGRVGFLRKHQPPVVFAPQVAYWRVLDRSALEPRWIFYLLRGPEFQANLDAVKTHGSMAADYVSLSQQYEFRLRFPPLSVQQGIATVLGALDDKIHANQCMNETLEAMARALFKSWFIDNCCEGSERAGWSLEPFGYVFKVPLRNGLTKPKSVRGTGTLMVNMGELFAHKRLGNLHMDRVPLTDAERLTSMLEIGDILFARQSLTLEGAGQCSIVTEANEERTFESHLIRCRLDDQKADSWYFFYYLTSAEGQSSISSIVSQVAAAGIRGSDLARLPVLVPPIEAQRKFGEIVRPLERRIWSNSNESCSLASIRDLLLPKLLSGELRIKDAEKLVESVA